jgi:hypothetical protein
VNKNLPPWAYLFGVWLLWFVAAIVVCGGMLAIGAMGLAAAG